MSVEENKATIRHVWDEVNKGNLTVIDECFADNFVRIAHDGKTMDRQGYKNMSSFILKNTHDLRITVDDMVGEGDKVAYRMTLTGTNSGKQVVFSETYFARFENGKIIEYVNLNRDISP
jgi:predicted ester cyclase